MEEPFDQIRAKLRSFERRYYLNFFLQGGVITVSLTLVYFLIISFVEDNLWMDSLWRSFAFFSLIMGFLYCLFTFLKKPFMWWLSGRGLGKEKSAKIIGSSFPSVKDQLLNLTQLASQKKKTALLEASIVQKTKKMKGIPFEKAVDLSKNKRYFWFLGSSVGLTLVLALLQPSILTHGAKRIVQFNRTFAPSSPFSFTILNEHMDAFPNEDFTLRLKLEGSVLPADVYIRSGVQIVKMNASSESEFQYTFKYIQEPISFQFQADGFYSDTKRINLIYRPELTQISMVLDFPKYVSRSRDNVFNTGNLEVPEGTKVTWKINTRNASAATIRFVDGGTDNAMQTGEHGVFTHSRFIHEPDKYGIVLENKRAKNKEKIAYSIAVKKDEYPQIEMNAFVDSVSFKTLLLGGYISDDYGLTALRLHYQKNMLGLLQKQHSLSLDINRGEQQQPFLYPWSLDSLHLEPGEKISYFLVVWDNDGVNGPKATRSSVYTVTFPGREEIRKNLDQAQDETRNELKKGMDRTEDLGNAIQKARKKIKGKPTMNWQDKKALEEILRQKDSLYRAIDELQQQNRKLNKKKDALLEQDKRIVEQALQLQKLMDELLDEKTKDLFNELQKLLRENADPSQIEKTLDRINRKESELENTLKRLKELLEHFRFDSALDQMLQQLKKNIDNQETLLEKTRERKNQSSPKTENEHDQNPEPGNQPDRHDLQNQLAKKQKELSGESKKLKQELENLKQLGKKINRGNSLPPSQEIDDVVDAQKMSEQFLDNDKKENSEKWQEKSIQKMQQMQKQMEQMRDAMQSELDMQNMESLRHILHDLIALSYQQEQLIKIFSKMPLSDPRYRPLSRQQMNVVDNFNTLKDSLLSLAQKDPFIGSIVTRELQDLKHHLDKVMSAVKERKRGNGASEMQWAMAGMNNLALMLDAHFEAMQKARMGVGKKQNKGPRLSQLQQQLNQQIEQLKKSGKTGRPLLEELAKMAREQERIRQAFERMRDQEQKKGDNMPGEDLPKNMEQTEMELLNKKITEETIKRQKKILSRLLEAEKAVREQDEEEERQGTTAKEYEKILPDILKEYLKLKKQEVELLKTVPPKLHPYYKKEVDQYFRRTQNHGTSQKP